MRLSCVVARVALAAGLVSGLAAGTAACGPGDREGTPSVSAPIEQLGRAQLRPAPLPDVTKVEAQLRERLQDQQRAVKALLSVAGTPNFDLAAAFGVQGKWCLAAGLATCAVDSLFNARELAPRDYRWAYYLAHAYRLSSNALAAREAMEQTVSLSPADVPARAWLARLLLDEGKPQLAASHIDAVVATAGPAAARAEQGRAALALQRTDEAVTHFKAALTLLMLADPLMDEVGPSLHSALDFATRGAQALDGRQYADATTLFRKGLEQAPSDAALHLDLGTALYLSGSAREAFEEFEAAARLAPGNARAQFTTGVLSEENGRDADAIARYTKAITLDPSFADARFSLANALRRSDRVEESLTHYRTILDVDPMASQARFGLAMGLVRMGRYREAKGAVDEALRVQPGQPDLVEVLARLLACAPDPSIRNGAAAASTLAALRRSRQGGTLTETAAMVAAASGRFPEAVSLQRQAMAEGSPEGGASRAMVENLALYEARQACREPWHPLDPVFQPRADLRSLGSRYR
jgi:tetratricopeptide (TPR) repeat protein